MTHPACTGPCQQGKQPCCTPEACQLPDESVTVDLAWALIVAALILCLLAVLAALFIPNQYLTWSQ